MVQFGLADKLHDAEHVIVQVNHTDEAVEIGEVAVKIVADVLPEYEL